jgi:segregation and condensation protein B
MEEKQTAPRPACADESAAASERPEPQERSEPPAEPTPDVGLPAAEPARTGAPRTEQTDAGRGESLAFDAEAALDPGLPTAEMLESDTLPAPEPVAAEELLAGILPEVSGAGEEAQLRAVVEAIIYVTEEPLTVQQIAGALQQPAERVSQILADLTGEFERPGHGIGIREVAGGYKMATKPEHHDAVRNFVRNMKAPLKLSLAALETLAVIAYKQPVTAPEIAEIRGVQGTGVLKTLLDRKLIAAAGRKNVIGKPILYKTTKDFLVQFGLKDLTELPSLKEFEEIRRMAFSDEAAAETGAGGSEPQPAGDPPEPNPPVTEPPPGEEEPAEKISQG